jgi:hypothetical protein
MTNINYRSISMALTVVVVVMAGYIIFLHTRPLPGESPGLHGVAGASSQQTGYPATNLNDGTPAAWGSDESLSDVYAYIVLDRPDAAVSRIRLSAFTPEGRGHLRDLRLIAAPSLPQDTKGWNFIGFSASVGGNKVGGNKESEEVISLPVVNDEEQILLVPNKSDKNYGAYGVWGVACLRSLGDVCNRLEEKGNGMYIREMRLEE